MDEWNTISAGRLLRHLTDGNMSMVNSPTFDPYQMMLNKQNDNNNIKAIKSADVTNYEDDDLKALEEFCQKHNILGFNCGNMNPRAALSFLKRKMGVIENDKSTNKKLLEG